MPWKVSIRHPMTYAQSGSHLDNSDCGILQGLIEKLGQEHIEVKAHVAEQLLVDMTQVLNDIDTAVTASSGWDGDHFIAKYNEFYQHVQKGRELDLKIRSAGISLKGVNRAAVNVTTNDARQMALQIRAVTKARPLLNQGMPSTVISWCGEYVLGIQPDATQFCPKTSESVRMFKGNVQIDYTTAHLCRKQSTTDKSAYASIVNGLGNVKGILEKNVEALDNGFTTNPSVPTLMAQLSPGKLTTKLMPWIPPAFHDGQMEAQHASSIALPWVFADQTFGFRGNLDMLPLNLFSGHLYQYRGASSIISFEMSNLKMKGMSPTTLNGVLCHWTPADAKRWMMKNTQVVHLTEGDMYYVPYGTMLWTIGVSTEKASISVWMPLMCPQLFEALDPSTSDAIRKSIDVFLETASECEPWNKYNEPLKRWIGAQ